MLQYELEDAILETNRKLDKGIKVVIKDHRSKDAILTGLISGMAFVAGSVAVQEIRNAYVRRKNRKWFESNKER